MQAQDNCAMNARIYNSGPRVETLATKRVKFIIVHTCACARAHARGHQIAAQYMIVIWNRAHPHQAVRPEPDTVHGPCPGSSEAQVPCKNKAHPLCPRLTLKYILAAP